MKGPDDDADAARHGRRGPDALARRPHRRDDRARIRSTRSLAFKAFNPAFVGLLGRGTQLTRGRDAGVHRLHPDGRAAAEPDPRPRRRRARRRPERRVRTCSSTGTPTRGAITCTFCHRLPLGTDGLSTFEGETQEFKIAHLRNLYQKVGMFGVAGGATVGDQVRGFGFLHDGSVSTVFRTSCRRRSSRT